MKLWYLDAGMNDTTKDKAVFARIIGLDSLGNRVEFVTHYYDGLEEDLTEEQLNEEEKSE